MSYQIVASEDEKCLLILLRQVLKIEHFMQIAREAGKLLKEKKWNRIIMDARGQPFLFSTMGEESLLKMIADQFPSRSRLAWLTFDLNKQDTHFITRFFRTHNMALAHDIALEMFSDVEKAIEWLFQNEYQIDLQRV